jgi:hypothetical protein
MPVSCQPSAISRQEKSPTQTEFRITNSGKNIVKWRTSANNLSSAGHEIALADGWELKADGSFPVLN